MRQAGLLLLCIALLASLGVAQESGGFQPAETSVWDAPYPRVAADGRVNFWSGPKEPMEKVEGQDDTKVPVGGIVGGQAGGVLGALIARHESWDPVDASGLAAPPTP